MKSICEISLNGALVAAALMALLVLPPATQTYAAEKSQKQQATTPGVEQDISLGARIQKRVAEGFSVIGPLVLQGASSSELVIAKPDGKEPITVSLKGRTVTVQDQFGNSLTPGSVQAGSNVIICQKKDKVAIYIVPLTKKESGDAKKK